MRRAMLRLRLVVLRILANTEESFDTQLRPEVPLLGITSIIQAISKVRQYVQAGRMALIL
jgi:hypothetical protein